MSGARPNPRFANGDLVVVARGPAAGQTLRIWYHFGHRLRQPDGALEYIYDVRPLHKRFGDPDAALGAVAVAERDLRPA
jgi:hypothetical protein